MPKISVYHSLFCFSDFKNIQLVVQLEKETQNTDKFMLKIRSSDTQEQTNLIEIFKKDKTCLSEFFQKNPKVYSANPRVKSELFTVTTIKRAESDRNLRSNRFSTQNVSRQFLKNRSTIKLFDKVPAESMPPLHIINQGFCFIYCKILKFKF